MGFLHQYHLVIKFMKGSTKRIINMLSSPPIHTTISSLSTILKIYPFVQDAYKKQYMHDPDFKYVYLKLTHNNRHDEKTNYFVKDGLLYNFNVLCVLEGERVQLIREAHSSQIYEHFGVGKTMVNLQRYVYWPKMQDQIAKYTRDYVLCYTSKPSNRNLGLCQPLPIPTRPWESISMEFMGGLLMKKREHD